MTPFLANALFSMQGRFAYSGLSYFTGMTTTGAYSEKKVFANIFLKMPLSCVPLRNRISLRLPAPDCIPIGFLADAAGWNPYDYS